MNKIFAISVYYTKYSELFLYILYVFVNIYELHSNIFGFKHFHIHMVGWYKYFYISLFLYGMTYRYCVLHNVCIYLCSKIKFMTFIHCHKLLQ